MPPIDIDTQLAIALVEGNMEAVISMLDAGATVDGHKEQPLPPIVLAVIARRVDMVKFLLERGADPERPITREILCKYSATAPATLGGRALHMAARSGHVEIVRLLLNRSRANPNATDNLGCTPLLVTCACPHDRVEVVRVLIEAGADPSLADKAGFIPLHLVARAGLTDLVNILHASAPSTLYCCASNGQNPLFVACNNGHESMVSKLLSLGAMLGVPSAYSDTFPLTIAAMNGFVGVMRILIEGGIRAVASEEALTNPLYASVAGRNPRALLLLLSVDGEEGRSKLANIKTTGGRLLHFAAEYCYPAAVSILLEAGADEAARDSGGRIPRDNIGVDLIQSGGGIAIRRMLQRGPAYRARSWAWPSGEGASASDSGCSETYPAAAAVPSSPPTMNAPSLVGVRIFGAKENSSSSLFAKLIGRYCAKD